MPLSSEGAVTGSRIAMQLRNDILEGRYRPGERLLQDVIASSMGSSRIPVRDALRILEAEGLVSLVANSTARVAQLSLADCVHTYLVRERLEPLVLNLSIPRLVGAQLDSLVESLTEMEGSTSVDVFLRFDRKFHLGTYGGAAEGEATRIVSRMWDTTHHYRREFSRRTWGQGRDILHMEHRLLLDCILRSDIEDAERVLVAHIRRTRLALETHPEVFEQR